MDAVRQRSGTHLVLAVVWFCFFFFSFTSVFRRTGSQHGERVLVRESAPVVLPVAGANGTRRIVLFHARYADEPPLATVTPSSEH